MLIEVNKNEIEIINRIASYFYNELKPTTKEGQEEKEILKSIIEKFKVQE